MSACPQTATTEERVVDVQQQELQLVVGGRVID